jgi:hypothetical protein
LPPHSASTARSDHYIVIEGVVGDDFVYNDPMGLGEAGPDNEISEADLLTAMRKSSAPGAGFAIMRPQRG